MSVCKYRAFIFLDQPPPWVSLTIPLFLFLPFRWYCTPSFLWTIPFLCWNCLPLSCGLFVFSIDISWLFLLNYFLSGINCSPVSSGLFSPWCRLRPPPLLVDYPSFFLCYPPAFCDYSLSGIVAVYPPPPHVYIDSLLSYGLFPSWCWYYTSPFL